MKIDKFCCYILIVCVIYIIIGLDMYYSNTNKLTTDLKNKNYEINKLLNEKKVLSKNLEFISSY